jgi:MFS family permease
MGFIFALTPLISSLINFSVSSLSDKVGRKRLLLSSRVCTVLTSGIYPLARDLFSLVGLSVFGSLTGFGYYLASPTIASNSEDKERVRLLSFVTAISTACMAASMIACGFLLMLFGFTFVFAIVALLQVFSFLLVLGLREGSRVKTGFKGSRQNFVESLSIRGLDKDVYFVSSSRFFTMVAYAFGEGFMLVLFLRNVLQAQPATIGLVQAGAFLLYAIPSLIFSKYILRLMGATSDSLVYAATLLPTSFLMLLMGSLSSAVEVFFVYSVFGIVKGFAIVPAMKFMCAAPHHEARAGKSFGLYELLGAAGSLVGGISAPIIAAVYGFRPLFIVAAAMYILAIMPIIVRRLVRKS